MLTCHGFIDAIRRHEIPGSEKLDSLLQHRQEPECAFFFALIPGPQVPFDDAKRAR